MIKIAFLLSFLLIFTACTKTVPYIKEYKLDTSVHINENTQTQCKNKSIKVVHAFSADNLMLNEMNYVNGQYNVDSFTQSQWSQSPNKAITSQTIKALENAQYYKHVANATSHVKSDLLLENNIKDFMQYFSTDTSKSYVKVVISATLVDRKTKKSLAYKRFEKIKESKSLDAYGGVVALNSALSDVLEEEVKWLGEQCR